MARDGSPESPGSPDEGTPEEAPSSLLPTNQFKVLNTDTALERLSSVPPSRPPPPAESASPEGSTRAVRPPAVPRKELSWVAQPWVMLTAGAVFACAVALSLYKLLQ